jgi:hypothetical protein
LLDRGRVFRQRKVEGGLAATALLRVGDGFSGRVVVVAEVFSAQARAAATVAVGEDVAALVLFWCVGFGVDDVVLHVSPHWVKKYVKSSKKKTCVRTSGAGAGFKCEARPGGRAFWFLLIFIF